MTPCTCCEDLHKTLEKMEMALKYVIEHGMTRQAYHLIERALKNNSEMP